MAKTRPGISVESDIWEHFRSEVPQGERSEVIQRLMAEYLDVESEDLDQLETRLDKKNGELESLKAEKEEVTSKIEQKRSEIKALESRISEQSRENQKKQEEFKRFLEVFRDQSWSRAEDIPSYWMDQLDMSAEELFEKAQSITSAANSLEEKIEVKA